MHSAWSFSTLGYLAWGIMLARQLGNWLELNIRAMVDLCAEHLVLEVLKSWDLFPFQGSRQMAEHMPVTLERSMFLGF